MQCERKLHQIIDNFIDAMDISCAETIYQTDRVAENALQFIEKICNHVGYKEFN